MNKFAEKLKKIFLVAMIIAVAGGVFYYFDGKEVEDSPGGFSDLNVVGMIYDKESAQEADFDYKFEFYVAHNASIEPERKVSFTKKEYIDAQYLYDVIRGHTTDGGRILPNAEVSLDESSGIVTIDAKESDVEIGSFNAYNRAVFPANKEMEWGFEWDINPESVQTVMVAFDESFSQNLEGYKDIRLLKEGAPIRSLEEVDGIVYRR